MESYTDYLRRVGADYADSGSEFTADDYREAARTIDGLASVLRTIARAGSLKGARAEAALALAELGTLRG